MSATARLRSLAGSASAFVVPTEMRVPRSDIWAEVGRAVELAYREPTPVGQAAGRAVAVALVVWARLRSEWGLG
jgi:hypothetical protein